MEQVHIVLNEKDLEFVQKIKERYGLRSHKDAVLIALRLANSTVAIAV